MSESTETFVPELIEISEPGCVVLIGVKLPVSPLPAKAISEHESED